TWLWALSRSAQSRTFSASAMPAANDKHTDRMVASNVFFIFILSKVWIFPRRTDTVLSLRGEFLSKGKMFTVCLQVVIPDSSSGTPKGPSLSAHCAQIAQAFAMQPAPAV